QSVFEPGCHHSGRKEGDAGGREFDCEGQSIEFTADRRYGTLSEGERKRVQIARALMTDPELMLLDEPAAGLDLGGREDLVRRLGDIAADLMAPALVLVTHHVEEIPPNFTDVLLLRDGKVVAQGPLELALTAENLSATFGLPLVLERHGDRWSARAAQ
ncbi:MAG TPA: ATP-binding cassette domain-containing protein, partial [Phycicoccus sp.]|nr:ATP-binding cassette domain-containing protein [Phycicoccus sp.]